MSDITWFFGAPLTDEDLRLSVKRIEEAFEEALKEQKGLFFGDELESPLILGTPFSQEEIEGWKKAASKIEFLPSCDQVLSWIVPSPSIFGTLPAPTVATEDKDPLAPGKAVEEAVLSALDDKSDEWKATMYMQLNALGMTLEKAKNIRRKMGVTK